MILAKEYHADSEKLEAENSQELRLFGLEGLVLRFPGWFTGVRSLKDLLYVGYLLCFHAANYSKSLSKD